jgi:hypothetical protein
MLLMTVATWVLTPLFWFWLGFLGVAVVAALVAGLSLSSIWLFKRFVPVAVGKNIIGSLVASGLMVVGIKLWEQLWPLSFLGLLGQIIFGVLIYLVVNILVGKKQLVTNLHHILPKWF